MFKRFARGFGAVALSAGLIASGAALAAPAQAAPTAPAPKPVYVAKPISVSAIITDGDSYKGRTIPVSYKGCKTVWISIRGKEVGTQPFDVKFSADIYRYSKKIKTVTLSTYSTAWGEPFCVKNANSRYGKFQVKNLRVKGWYYLKDTNGQYVYDADGRPVRPTFNYALGKNSKTFNLKGSIDGSLGAKRPYRSSKVTFTAKTKVFSDKAQKWVSYSPSGAQLQVKSGSKWKKVKSLKFKSGKSVYTVKSSSKKYYRLYVPEKYNLLGGTTRGFKI